MKNALQHLTPALSPTILLLAAALARGETAVQAWVQRYHGPGFASAYAEALAVDGDHNVIVTGTSDTGGYNNDYTTIKYSCAGIPLWTNTYNGPGNGLDASWFMAVDGSNSVIVTGYSSSGWESDYATIKYSSAGVSLWTNRYNGPGDVDDYASAIAVDGSNNVIITGYSTGSGGYLDYATIKYSPMGVPLWTNRYNGSGNDHDQANAVALDGSNNVIVTGGSQGSESSWDYATIKYSSAGEPLWTNRCNGPGNSLDVAWAVDVDGSNNVLVTGISTGASGNYDYATIKYSSDGTPLWTNRFNGPANGSDRVIAVRVDRNNEVIVTGTSVGSFGNNEYATIKYSNSGVPLWTNRFSSPGNHNATATALALDGSNNVVVTGVSPTSGNDYDSDFITIKYSSSGVPLWTNNYNGPANDTDQPTSVAVDPNGNVIVTGFSAFTPGNYDFATVKHICVREPILTGLQPTNGTFQMRVDNVLQPGTLVIEACTNLGAWVPVFTNTTPSNTLLYTDPKASNSPTRFYRAFQFP
jgi:uncharacterized delta-60 repeat protein